MCCNSYSLLYCTVSSEEDKLVTGGADSQLVVWRDVTEETLAKQLEDRHQRALQDQELANLLHHGDLLPALKLALTLERPATVLNIVQSKLLSFVTLVCFFTVLQYFADKKKLSPVAWQEDKNICT